MSGTIGPKRLVTRQLLLGTLLVLLPCGINIGSALLVKLQGDGTLPLGEFVDVYVRFRHTHHFDPLAWPAALWLGFLWPIAPAIWAWKRRFTEVPAAQREVLRQTARIFAILVTLQVVAFFLAGVWFVSETLVQLMLWRFSIFVKLLSCIGASYAACDLLGPGWRRRLVPGVPVALALVVGVLGAMESRPHPHWLTIAVNALHEHRSAIVLFVLLCFVPAGMALAPRRQRARTPGIYVMGIVSCILIGVIGWDKWLGWGMTPEPVDRDYLKVCTWAREATPIDAIFLVPPDESEFRLQGQRAIVVNFKHVPQLSGEILQWEQRMKDVLGVETFGSFPRDYVPLLKSLGERYESRPPGELLAVAERYGARYIVVNRSWGEQYRPKLAYRTGNGRYFVYDRLAG